MQLGTKIISLLKTKVKKKYTLRLVQMSRYKIDKVAISFDSKTAWALSLEEFKKAFPRISSFMLYKAILGRNVPSLLTIDYMDYLSTSEREAKSDLFVRENLVIFEDIAPPLVWRKSFRRCLETLELLEKRLEKVRMSAR